MIPDLKNKIFHISGQTDFTGTALEVFKYQAEYNQIYRDFINFLGIDISSVAGLEDIPFLPVGLFKRHTVITGSNSVNLIFESSGTSGNITSRHYVTDSGIYEESLLRTFRLFYGDPSEYFFAALLPSYTERENSSLIYMVNRLIKESSSNLSGFYNADSDDLLLNIEKAKHEGLRVILFGVSFALLDLAERYPANLSGIIVMETGGMKGRRKEMTREELHSFLRQRFNVNSIHSEYGMTELLSQAYSKGRGIFNCPPWMKIMIREPQDPLSIITEPLKTGGINIVDLANINSCSFIATDDLGKLHENDSFEVIGRFDTSDIRGCNLLMEQ